MTYNLRHSTAEDGEEILELWHGFTEHLSKYDDRYQHKEDADDRWLRYFENQLVDSKYGTVIVAEDEETGELIGVLEARVMGDHPIFRLKDHGYINGHYVREDHWNNGVGTALIEEAHEWFADSPRDIDFYRIDVVDGDEKAEEVYESLGFDPVEHVYERSIEEQ
ncbi:GNAT family N-acetyltransferase [Halalkalicoccus jeotgali]|uniref:GCN5-related N-acetyltransferase n=1 Tax=Halalkalicoccus jeotgali (strain DSM 18796 / CECT 7217 / JCM 14584 / KCTC 4019 / B3) TaxID=795797 RepID=D8JB32_HALJB|nr:GNAT family N-acetyltransferase [Halalkalicoccus jeotgali]ADJ16485.1 GCN5-related N-acetyltransferase [Halalkalicoccus jeotgali B3]ELY41419.1 N-acetyltransferase GCN5 [Halalkalicoccus jeotgali B3]